METSVSVRVPPFYINHYLPKEPVADHVPAQNGHRMTSFKVMLNQAEQRLEPKFGKLYVLVKAF